MNSSNKIYLEKILECHYDFVEIELYSDRNHLISRLSDVSNLNPKAEVIREQQKVRDNGDVWFPVVDVEITCDMHAKVKLSDSDGFYAINGYSDCEMKKCQDELILPAEKLEHWENNLFLTSPDITVSSFCIVKRVRMLPHTQCKITTAFTPLGTEFSGKAVGYGIEKDGKRTKVFESTLKENKPINIKSKTQVEELNKESLQRAIIDSAKYLQRSINTTSHSPFYGGLYCFYDLDARTYRLPSWIWQWGPAIHLMLRAADYNIFNPTKRDKLLIDALSIGKISLSYQVNNEAHPTHGLGSFRCSPRAVPPGCVEHITGGSDSNFLSGWGWIPLYRKFKDKSFLDSAYMLAKATERVMNQFELIPQDYSKNISDWSNHTLDESGFGTEGLAELFLVTGDDWVKNLTCRYMDMHVRKFELEDGLWERSWNRKVGKAAPNEYMTRGLGWAMEGLLSCARIKPEGPYLEKACSMAEHLLKWQNDEGHWNFFFNRSSDEVGVSEKGTALWSILFYRLYDFTGDLRHLKAAQRALSWCVKNQYYGPDRLAHGAIVGCNPQSGIVYRKWFNLTCTYAAAFAGIAACVEYERQMGMYLPWNKRLN